MKKVFLKRMIDNGKQTLGSFVFEGLNGDLITLISLELPWKDNTRSISCIPKGTYKVITTYSNKFKKDMWLIKDVNKRDGIRIHSATYYSDLEGCIALGKSLKDINSDGNLDILESREAIKIAKEHLGEEFELDIS